MSTTTFVPSCSALIDTGRISYKKCTRPATFAERNGKAFRPICNVHASGIKRRSYARPDDVVSITDEMLVTWEREAAERKARDEEEQAKKTAQRDQAHEAHVLRRQAEDQLTWSFKREDKTDHYWNKDGMVEYIVPTWIVQQGDNSWTKIEVSVQRESRDMRIPFTVKLYAASELTASATKALAQVLTEAANVAAVLNKD